MGVMKTVDVAVDELTKMAAKYNPRKINESDMDSLRHSIREWGFVEPVVVNKSRNTVVGGHQRIEAAKLEGVKTVPVVYVELDEESERSLNLALNRISGEWDDTKLLGVLAALSDEYVVLAGFTESDVEDLSAKIEFSSSSDGDDAVGAVSPAERGWDDAGIRSVILPYDVDTHARVLKMMEKARKEMKTESNSDLVLALLSDA